MMSTQNQAEHAVIHSSIALLQERFKHLQRVKEMREKKELLRLFSDHYKINTPPPPPPPPPRPSTTTTSDNSYNHEHVAATHNTSTTTLNHNNYVHDHDDNDELQIFLPPNYYHANYNRTKPTSFHSSSLSLSHNNSNTNISHNNYHHNNLSETSLSLWPPTVSYSNATTTTTTTTTTAVERCRRGSFDTPLSTLGRSPSSCLSSAFKFEDSQHVTDVDTTLHL